jgi:hypothetical protein
MKIPAQRNSQLITRGANMSTESERLREKAADLERRQHARDASQREEEAKRTQMDARVRRMEAAYLAKAQALAKATGAPIQVWRSAVDLTDTGFRIRIGGVYSLVARLVEGRWEVTRHSRAQDPSFTYPTDQEFENAQEDLLEPIIANALEAVVREKEAQLPVSAPSDPSVKAPLLPRLWRRIQSGLSGLSIVPRRNTKKAVAAEAKPGPVSARPADAHPQPEVENAQLSTPGDAEALIRERLEQIRERSERTKT